MKSTLILFFGSIAIVAAVFSAAFLEGAANAHQNAISKSQSQIAYTQ